MTGRSLSELIRRRAQENPQALALLAPGRIPLCYGSLNRQVAGTGAALNALGIGRNDRVALALADGPETAVATLAVAAHATCAPLNPAYRRREFDSHLADLDCRALVVSSGSESPAIDAARSLGISVFELQPILDGEAGLFALNGARRATADPAVGEAQPDDIALALHTSGTSARPKLVPLKHRHICASAYSIRDAVELTPADRCLSVMPLFHIHGLSAIFASVAAGGSAICTSGFSAEQFFEWLETLRPTWYTAAPAIHQAVLDLAVRHPAQAARSGLRFIRSASAAMPRRLMTDLERILQVPFVEAYGMTEAAPQIASNRLSQAERRAGSVGRAAGPRIAVVDDANHFLKPGETGEIVIRGENVVAEYAQTAADGAFVDGWLRTGDLGYLDEDGYLFLTGRLNDVINRGGEKISPCEVEEALLSHPDVAEAAAFAIPHPSLGEEVGAAIVLRNGAAVTEAEIREFTAARLAYFKVPQQVIIAAGIPQSSTGKLERSRLAERLGFVAPSGRLQQRTAEIWLEVLGVERVGIHDNFFRLGGNSLTATQVAVRLGREFGVDLPAQSLFAKPTIAELAALVSETQPACLAAPTRRANSGEFPLSFAQERIWFLHQLDPASAAYNISCPLWLTGPLNVAALEQSLDEVSRRHETLRAAFPDSGGTPAQTISPAHSARLEVVDLTALAESEREAEALRLAAADAGQPFDLAHSPLFRARLIRLSGNEHALLLTTHHMVCDGWSVAVLYRELSAFCRSIAVPELPIQYADFAQWQREWLQAGRLEAQLAYWRRQLRDLPALDLTPKGRHPDNEPLQSSAPRVRVSRDVTGKLLALAKQEDATLFMILMAAFQVLLFRYTGQDDFGVGTPIANRTSIETESLIGFFANTLVLRAKLSRDPTFRQLLERVRVTAERAYAHQDVPFDKLVEELRPQRCPDRTPLFQVMFAFQNVPETGLETRPLEDHSSPLPAFEFAPGVEARPFKMHSGAAKFDLTLYAWQTPDGLGGTWQCKSSLFESSAIERLSLQFEALLQEIADDPDRKISADHGFLPLFEANAARTPDRIAVECGSGRLTYAELNGRANQLARHLHTAGVEPATLVGISLPRSAEMLVALLAVWKAGCAYVPLDPQYPPGHLKLLSDDARLRVLVTEARLIPLFGDSSALFVCIDADRERISMESTENPAAASSADGLAYVIYTSGSTGEPKGVMVTHANVRHCALAMREATGIEAGDRYLHTASFSFSSSVRQFAVPLACGAAVVIALQDEIRDPTQLLELIRRARVSVFDFVPSYWRTCFETLRQQDAKLPATVRLILSASERLFAGLARDWIAAFGSQAKLVNMYGQTETTGIVSVYPIGELTADQDTVPIGHPIANTTLHILDELRNPVDAGVTGDLYVSGAGVGRGYLNRPDLTAERFADGLYNTGDRARYLPGGAVEFLGRADDQVKIRGFRIEPAEVEAALRRHPWVWESAVVAQSEPDGSQRLAAFIVARERTHPERLSGELRGFLKTRLPDYMIPTAITAVESLPLTANHKIDRRALSARTAESANGAKQDRQKPFTGPRTTAEKVLVDVWRQVLRLERVSVQDNFFDLGGDSLLSVRMVSLANQAGLDVTLKQFFQHQTIADLAQAAARGRRAGTASGGDAVVRITLDSLRAWSIEALVRAGLAPEGAAIVAEVQLEASLRGQPTHNVDSIPRYARRLLAGAMNPRPDIRMESETAFSARIDGDNGPGQWVATVAMDAAIRKAQAKGIGLITVRRSNHFGAAGHYAWMAATESLIGLCTTNGPVILAPTGGVTPTFGNNPLGVGIPAGRHRPILLDIAMSVAPRGKIGLQLAEGKPLPPGWILDRFGRASVDPADLAAGLGVPIGGHKGYGLALALEALSGALSGAGFCTDHTREQMRDHTEARDIGHFFMAIDPELFSPRAEFAERIDRMIDITRSSDRAENVDEILIPGESELRQRERNLREGVPVRMTTYSALLKYSETAGLKTALVRCGP